MMKDKMFLPDYLKVMIEYLADLNKRVEKISEDLKTIKDADNKSTAKKEKEYRTEGNRHESPQKRGVRKPKVEEA